jgi:four helix bundle protein
MTSYRDLEIYNDSKSLAIELHFMTLKLPKFELHEEGSQIRRSSKAVTAMIVEGYCRKRYKAEYIKFLIYSLSECDETILHLEFLTQTKSAIDRENIDLFKDKYNVLSKKINNFIKWIEANH